MAIIAPFWATTDTHFAFREDHSKVYYQVYSQTKESSSEILSMASKDVKLYGDSKKFANFAASWVLVVTWQKLCPYVYYPYSYYYYSGENFALNCPWVSVSFSFFPVSLSLINWVLVMTWHKLGPYVYYYDYDNRYRWVRRLLFILLLLPMLLRTLRYATTSYYYGYFDREGLG